MRSSITQTLNILFCAVSVLFVFFVAATAYADSGGSATAVICDNGKTVADLSDCTQTCSYQDGSQTETKTIPQDQDCATTGGNCSTLTQCDLISKYINPFVDLLAALVGVAVVTSIIIGGIQYSSSGGDPGKAAAAKERIRNAIIALIVFIFLYSMLNFLIPGGIV